VSKTILILAANPKSTPRLRLDQEVREIDSGLQRARHRDEFVLRQQWAVRAQDVRRAMLDYAPSIVHFCGHGHGEAGIAMEDEMGEAQLVSADALAGFFALFADSVQCVVLNACYSEIQAQAIAQHIDYVVGMRQEIADAASLEFAVAFYDALGAGRSFEFAFKLACNAIQMAGIPASLKPVMVTRMGGQGRTQRTGQQPQPQAARRAPQPEPTRGDTRPQATRDDVESQTTKSEISLPPQTRPQTKSRRSKRQGTVYRIDREMCISCGACQVECPVECIDEDEEAYRIDVARCTGCGTCVEVCPTEAIEPA
jgi:ferredoxin